MDSNSEPILKEILDTICEIKNYDLPINVQLLLSDLEIIVEMKEMLIQLELNRLQNSNKK
jgi:hypothetical protein